MSLFNVFDIAGSVMAAQSQRLNVVASNLSNADSATSSNGQPYRAKQVIFGATKINPQGASGVRVSGVIDDPTPMKQVYEPQHPLANPQGYVTMPNVNVVGEMVNMISASRSYQNNVDMMNTAKSMLMKVLTIGQ